MEELENDIESVDAAKDTATQQREPVYDETSEIDLTSEISLVMVAVVAGIIALPFSTALAMILCFGSLTLLASWFAVAPLFRHTSQRRNSHLRR